MNAGLRRSQQIMCFFVLVFALIALKGYCQADANLPLDVGNSKANEQNSIFKMTIIEQELFNGDFEYVNGEKTGMPPGWGYYNSSGARDDQRGIVTDAFSGKYALHLKQGSGKGSWLYTGEGVYRNKPRILDGETRYLIKSNTLYQVNAYVKGSPSIPINIILILYDEKGEKVIRKIGEYILTDKYNEITAQFYNLNESEFRIAFYLYQSGEIYLDNVKLSEVNYSLIEGEFISDNLRNQLTAYLETICDWIVKIDVGSGELKITGDATKSIFVNGNFARALMSAYEINKNPIYLKEAIAWCDYFISKQKHIRTSRGNDGGYWTDDGVDGNIYLADTGTATLALAYALKYVSGEKKQEYIRTIQRYALFVTEGCESDPQGLGRGGSLGWITQQGALGCGYYKGHLSLRPYTIATATTGGGLFSALARINQSDYFADISLNATRWILNSALDNGQIPYIIDGDVTTNWPFDTMAYCSEAVIGVDLRTRDIDFSQHMKNRIKKSIHWILSEQNYDGTWGVLGSQDQQRSPQIIGLLVWYYYNVERNPLIARAILNFAHYCLNPENSKKFGVNEKIRVTGFVGLAVAEILRPGITFEIY